MVVIIIGPEKQKRTTFHSLQIPCTSGQSKDLLCLCCGNNFTYNSGDAHPSPSSDE